MRISCIIIEGPLCLAVVNRNGQTLLFTMKKTGITLICAIKCSNNSLMLSIRFHKIITLIKL